MPRESFLVLSCIGPTSLGLTPLLPQLPHCQRGQDSGGLWPQRRLHSLGLRCALVARYQQVPVPLPWISIRSGWTCRAWSGSAALGPGSLQRG